MTNATVRGRIRHIARGRAPLASGLWLYVSWESESWFEGSADLALVDPCVARVTCCCWWLLMKLMVSGFTLPTWVNPQGTNILTEFIRTCTSFGSTLVHVSMLAIGVWLLAHPAQPQRRLSATLLSVWCKNIDKTAACRHLVYLVKRISVLTYFHHIIHIQYIDGLVLCLWKTRKKHVEHVWKTFLLSFTLTSPFFLLPSRLLIAWMIYIYILFLKRGKFLYKRDWMCIIWWK